MVFSQTSLAPLFPAFENSGRLSKNPRWDPDSFSRLLFHPASILGSRPERHFETACLRADWTDPNQYLPFRYIIRE